MNTRTSAITDKPRDDCAICNCVADS